MTFSKWGFLQAWQKLKEFLYDLQLYQSTISIVIADIFWVGLKPFNCSCFDLTFLALWKQHLNLAFATHLFPWNNKKQHLLSLRYDPEMFPVPSRVTFAAMGLNDATDANMPSNVTQRCFYLFEFESADVNLTKKLNCLCGFCLPFTNRPYEQTPVLSLMCGGKLINAALAFYWQMWTHTVYTCGGIQR